MIQFSNPSSLALLFLPCWTDSGSKLSSSWRENPRNWKYSAAAIPTFLTLLAILWGDDLVSEYQYQRILSSACKDNAGFMSDGADMRPVIETTLPAQKAEILSTLVKAHDYRDRVLREIKKPARSRDEIRIQIYSLHVLATQSPRKDLLNLVKRGLESRDESVSGWACYDLECPSEHSFFSSLDKSDLEEFEKILSDSTARLNRGSDFQHASFLQGEFEDARRLALKSIGDCFERIKARDSATKAE